jgi:hypothetical protein
MSFIGRFKSSHGHGDLFQLLGGLFRGLFQLSDWMFPRIFHLPCVTFLKHVIAVKWNLSMSYSHRQMRAFIDIFRLSRRLIWDLTDAYSDFHRGSDGTFPMHIPAVRWNLSDAYYSCPMGPFPGLFQLSNGTLPMHIPSVRWDLS